MKLLDQFINYFSYVSLSILLIGIILQLIYVNHNLFKWGMIYFLLLFMVELVGQLYPKVTQNSNLFLFSFSSFIHFYFLCFLYLVYFNKVDFKKYLMIVLLFVAPMVINTIINHSIASFNSYDRVIYSFSIMLLVLGDTYILFKGKTLYTRIRIILNNTVLIFFALDTFLAIPSNYLVNENMELVAWFWFLRAIILQVYYSILIYYLWKDGKTQMFSLSE